MKIGYFNKNVFYIKINHQKKKKNLLNTKLPYRVDLIWELADEHKGFLHSCQWMNLSLGSQAHTPDNHLKLFNQPNFEDSES